MAKITNPEEPAEKPEVLPTEQLPVEAPPVTATSETTETADAKQPSAIRRHPVATAVAAGVVAVLLAIGLTAWGVGSAVSSSLTSAASTTAPTTAPATPTAIGGRKVFRGTIESVSGDTWTVLTRSGKTITVDISPTTAFGAPRRPADASSFSTGDAVIIVATGKATSTLTAIRVVAPRAGASTPVPTSTPTI
jgi:Domain of unknown function (DUF5666)